MSTFDFSTLITDRSQSDLTVLQALLAKPMTEWTEDEKAWFLAASSKGAYNYTDLNRVETAMEYLHGLLTSYGYATGYKNIRKNRNLTNKVTNGDFSDELTGWTISSHNTVEVGNGVAHLTMTNAPSTATGTYPNYQAISGTTPGHVYFSAARAHGKPDNVKIPRVYISVYDSADDTTSFPNIFGLASSNVGAFTRRGLRTALTDTQTITRIAFGISPGNTNGDEMWVDDIMVVDLTEAFGAGSEPDIQECLDLIPVFQGTYSITDKWREGDVPTASDMAQFIANISALRRTISIMPTTPEVPADMEGLTYTEANNIEQILKDIEFLINNMAGAWFYSGDLYAGEI